MPSPSDHDAPPSLRIQTGATSARRQRHVQQSTILVALGLTLGALAGGWIFWWFSRSSPLPAQHAQLPQSAPQVARPEPPPAASSTDQPASPDGAPQPSSAAQPDSAAHLDSAPLWQSPTTGHPCQLVHLPAGAQMIVVIRLAELLAHAEGNALLDGLGKWGAWLRNELPGQLGIDTSNLSVLHIAFYAAADGTVRHAIVAQCRQPLTLDDLARHWSDAHPVTIADTTVLHRGQDALWPTAGRLAVMPWDEIETVIAAGESPIELRSDLAALLPATDDQRLFTVLSATAFLQDARNELFSPGESALIDELLDVAGRDTRSLLLSLHADQDLFFELGTLDSAQRPRAAQGRDFAARWRELPDRASRWLAQHTPPPQGMPLWERLPSMLEALADHSRLATIGHQQWVRAYLPVAAGQNLAWGFRLAVNSTESTGITTSTSVPQAAAPKTLAERLQQRTSLSFPRNTLERALMQLAEEIGVTIEIRGQDLQVEGITKNQSFGLDLRDRPASEILDAILQQASPEGKLMYRVVGPPGDERVIVTTRQGAATLETRGN